MQTFVFSKLAVVICQAFSTGTHIGISKGLWRRYAAPATIAAALTSLLACAPAHAIGLGELGVQSGLGQALRATISVLGSEPATRPASCYTARLSTADGAFIVSPRIALVGGAGGSKLVLATSVALSEPALSLTVEVACGDAVRKEFMLLLDPPLALAAPVLLDRPARAARTPAPAAQRAVALPAVALPADVTPTETASSETAAIVTAPAATTVPARPSRPRLRPVAAAALQPTASQPPAAAGPLAKPVRNVLRMSPRASTADTDLINAIGLRLALADRLAVSNAAVPVTGNAADPASLAADRAARARFAEVLRGDTGTDAAAGAAEQRLQQLQEKTRLLEKEAARLKLLALQDAAARSPAVHSGNDNLLLAGLVALLVASLVAIAWLTRRMKHLQRRNRDWEWDENVSAADARAARTEPAVINEYDAALSLEEEARAESAARAARTALAEAEARELRQAKAEADTRHSLDDSFWETAATPVLQTIAMPAIKPAATWAVNPAAVSADLAELAVLASAASSASPLAVPIAPVVAAVAVGAKAEPVTRASGPEIEVPSAAAAPLEMTPPPFLPDLDFPDTPIAPLEFIPSTILPIALKTPALQPVATLPLPSASASRMAAGPDALQFAEIRVQNTSVEEISDIMQEAEFWLSLHDLERAAEVLEPYATYEQPGSPLPWLYLFELYRDLGWQEKYDNLRDRFQRIFNGKAPTWDEQKLVLPGAPQRGVEDVPHVALKLTTLWQSEEVLPYLESLLVDDRDGTRAGFDLPIYKEIMFLILLAYELQQSKQYLKAALGTSDAPILV